MQLVPRERLAGLQITVAHVKGQGPNHLTEHLSPFFCAPEETE